MKQKEAEGVWERVFYLGVYFIGKGMSPEEGHALARLEIEMQEDKKKTQLLLISREIRK